jgi:hypothetical protein
MRRCLSSAVLPDSEAGFAGGDAGAGTFAFLWGCSECGDWGSTSGNFASSASAHSGGSSGATSSSATSLASSASAHSGGSSSATSFATSASAHSGSSSSATSFATSASAHSGGSSSATSDLGYSVYAPANTEGSFSAIHSLQPFDTTGFEFISTLSSINTQNTDFTFGSHPFPTLSTLPPTFSLQNFDFSYSAYSAPLLESCELTVPYLFSFAHRAFLSSLNAIGSSSCLPPKF